MPDGISMWARRTVPTGRPEVRGGHEHVRPNQHAMLVLPQFPAKSEAHRRLSERLLEI